MKKFISVLLACAIVLAFAGCSQKDDSVDESNEPTVNQSEGENATSEPLSAEDDTKKTQEGDTKQTDSKTSQNATEKPTEKTTKAATSKKEETTVKRKIKLNVQFPYYNSQETTVKIEYKAAGDKKYTSLFDDDEEVKVTLDQVKTQSFEIDKKIAGDVDVKITLDGVELLKNHFVISGKDSQATIELISGMEMIDGGMD